MRNLEKEVEMLERHLQVMTLVIENELFDPSNDGAITIDRTKWLSRRS